MKHSPSWGKRALAALGVAALAVPTLAGTAAAVTTPQLPEEGTGSLTIYKYAMKDGVTASEAERTGEDADRHNLPQGAELLGGASFKLEAICYQGNAIDLTTTAGWEQAAKVKDVDGITGDYAVCAGDPKTATTGTEGADLGKATFPGLTKTLYKVTETSAPSTVKKLAKPFVVTVPLGKADGSWINDVVVFPKNETADKPKKALVTGESVLGDVASDADKAVWTLTATVPALPDGATAFTEVKFEDTLATALGTFESGDFAVSMTKNGTDFTDFNTTGSAGSNVVVNVTPTSVQAGDVLVVKLTTDITGSGSVTNQFTFSTRNNKPGDPGTTDPSDPQVTPTVNYGTVKITKTDASTGTALDGVKFKFCEANDLENPTGCKQQDKFLNVGTTAADGTGLESATAAGGVLTATLKIAEGAASTTTATAKSFCAVETEALDGYILNDDNRVTCFKLQTSHTTDAPLEQSITNVKNTAWNANLPVTGAQGLVLLVLAGSALVAIALGSALVIRHRQQA